MVEKFIAFLKSKKLRRIYKKKFENKSFVPMKDNSFIKNLFLK